MGPSLRQTIGALAAALAFLAVSPTDASPTLRAVLDAHLAMLHRLHVVVPNRLVVRGTLSGLALQGAFATWRDGDKERYDEALGVRSQRTLRLGERAWVQNENGDVRELHGPAARRQLTNDFIDSSGFALHPEADELLGPARLPDGRDVWDVRVSPPGGEPYVVSLDARTSTIDRKVFQEGEAAETFVYSNYQVTKHVLYPVDSVQSNGDREFDITSHVTDVSVNDPIESSVFAPFVPATVDAAAPVTVPLIESDGHLFVRAQALGKPLLLLLDSGSQGVFLDTDAARRLGLVAQGTLEVRGARRMSGAGVAPLDAIHIADASLPLNVVSVVDLSSVTYRGLRVDGVLGYPFFAAAEVRVDPDRSTMTFGKPGSLPELGAQLDLDTDRQLPELAARANDVEGRFLVDTGNTNELLLFHDFVQAHPGMVIFPPARSFAQNRGVGGSDAAVPGFVDRLKLGPFDLYHRYADAIFASSGAFADRTEAGNIGLGTLRNFIFTFDLANRKLYLEKSRSFDDGRYRPQYDPKPTGNLRATSR